MPVLKLYPNGLTAGCPPRKLNPKPSLRDECKGWSLRSSRSNTRFLYSVVSPDLPVSGAGRPLLGLSGSLTLRRIPPSHEDWISVRRAFVERLRRKGLYRLHWLTEWQRRGAPHLHFAAWFDASKVAEVVGELGLPVEAFSSLVSSDWLQLSAPFRAGADAQYVEPIFDELGWLQYLAKHASRGAAHYQRAIGSIPAGWQKTGRMWGHLGDFPTRDPLGLELDDLGWFCFRRIVRRWRIAQARSSKCPRGRRVRSARRMLCCPDPLLSRVRGVSEWIGLELGLSIVEVLARAGYKVDCHE